MIYIFVPIFVPLFAAGLQELHLMSMESGVSLIMGLIILWQIRHRK